MPPTIRLPILVLLLVTMCAFGDTPEDKPEETSTSTEEVGLFPKVTTTEAGSAGTGDYETTIQVRRPITAASTGTIRERDIKLRPLRRPADILQVTPGLFVVQHAGGGKANQYFLRGYDADHGTDVALSVDGIPVNQVSHGHGQGYADLHWLIPETVDRIEVLKGTYFPHLGDFATAGGVNIVTRRTLPYNQVSLSGGSFGTMRALAVTTERFAGITPLIAAEGYYTDGPFLLPERTRRYNVFTKFTKDFSSRSSLTFGATAYGGEWRASGQIPNREVIAGRLNRFGNIDPTEGGDSDRYGLFASYAYQPTEDSKLSVLGYFNYYRLNLFSNFTFFAADPVNGDGINQNDKRTTQGVDTNYRFLSKTSGLSFETTIGLQGRNDSITNGLFNVAKRQRLGTVRDNDVSQQSLSTYVNEEITWTPWLRTATGLRGDYFHFDVVDRAGGGVAGSRDAAVLSPKASAIFSPASNTDLFLNYGQGFHSNDARGIAQGAQPLNKVFTYEVGARSKLADGRLDLAGALFLQDSDGELVYVGDGGGTDNKGPSRRLGVEVEARLKITDWLYADTDLNFVKPTLRDVPSTANAIPNAPTRIITAGVTAQHPKGYFGRFGMFHIADRPATQDRFLTSEGFTRFDTTFGYRQKSYELALAVLNLFDAKWREAQFATASLLPGENNAASPPGTRPDPDGGPGIQDLHFTPGVPLSVQATATVFF